MRMIKSAPRRRIIEKPEIPQYLDNIVEAIRYVEKKEKRSIVKRLDPLKYNEGQVIHFSPSKSPEKPLNKGVPSDSTLYIPNVEISKQNVYVSPTPEIVKKSEKSTGQNVIKSTTQNVINWDWFETTIYVDQNQFKTIDRKTIEIGEHLIFENQFQRTYRFMTMYNVIYLGELIGVLQAHPIMSVKHRHENEARFKLSNRLCYQTDRLDIYKEFLEESKSKHGNLTRFDIAVDGDGAKKARELAARQMKGGIIKRKGKALFHTSRNSKNEIENFRVGSSQSNKIATIYNKSCEIENSEKTYIADSWKLNNLAALESEDSRVDRFELRLYSKAMKNYDWEKLDDSSYLASIVKTETKNWFEFYKESKDTNRYRNDKKNTMDWIDWDEIEGKLLPKNKAVAKSGVHRAKRMIKDSLYLEIVEGRPCDKELIAYLRQEYCLHKWMEDRMSRWSEEFDREKKYRELNGN